MSLSEPTGAQDDMPSTSGCYDESAKDFEAVRAKELDYVLRRRQSGEGVANVDDVAESLIGLALSGGGIRSATTNLGVLQALSRMGILRLVDYMSTVSGGGYIGGCLSALLSGKRSDLFPIEAQRNFDYGSRRELAFTTEWHQFPFNAERGTRPKTSTTGCAWTTMPMRVTIAAG